jgi:hypothetical protein
MSQPNLREMQGKHHECTASPYRWAQTDNDWKAQVLGVNPNQSRAIPKMSS